MALDILATGLGDKKRGQNLLGGSQRKRKDPDFQVFSSAPGEIRTPDLRFRRRLDGVGAGGKPRIYGVSPVV
jgi:hypothetical protein